jgi:hypothetical protein
LLLFQVPFDLDYFNANVIAISFLPFFLFTCGKNKTMIKGLIGLGLLVCLQQGVRAQVNLKNIKKQINKNIATVAPATAALSNDDIIKGLKEALTVGANNSTTYASRLDGFFKNDNIKIPFPPGTKNMESILRSMGMGNQVDKAVLTMNRAAETAAKDAAPVFINAIKGMSITDGMTILKGGDDAATNYLKTTTSSELMQKFKPIIQNALQQVEITRYWNPLITSYDKVPFVEKMNPDLDAYVTDKAMSGLFFLLAQEEGKIRKDPAARVNDTLKKVFGQK